jgi:hypothetical protein
MSKDQDRRFLGIQLNNVNFRLCQMLHFPYIFNENLNATVKFISKDSWSPGRVSNQVL